MQLHEGIQTIMLRRVPYMVKHFAGCSFWVTHTLQTQKNSQGLL